MNYRKTLLISATILSMVSPKLKAESAINLAGEWRFDTDKQDTGITEKWFAGRLTHKISLPGSMAENGYGKPGSPGAAGIPGWSGWRAEKIWHPVFRKDYRGAAWYQRDITIPATWQGQHIRLFLERVCWVSDLWVDDKKIGPQQQSLSAPHIFEIGTLAPGKHQLTIRVDNRQLHDIGCNTHAYHEQSLTIFNGIIGKIELSARPQIFIENNRVFADANNGKCENRLSVINSSAKTEKGLIELRIQNQTASKELLLTPGTNLLTLTVKVDSIKKWDEFEHPLYSAEVNLKSRFGNDTLTSEFGFRSIETKGHQFILNGLPLLLRGEASNAMFPLTGHLPMTVAEWSKIIKIYKSYGLNHLRCHSWTPPQAAFTAADTLGFFIQAELPNGEDAVLHHDGDAWRQQEFLKIIDTYGNHPSFMFFTNGNEAKTDQIESLKALVRLGKKRDNRHLYSTMSNPEASRNGDGFECDQYLVSHHGKGGCRRLERIFNSTPPNTTDDYRNTYIRNLPYVSHEVGQWYVYPDIRTIKKYTGVVEPRNLIEFKNIMAKAGLLNMADDFVDASGRLSLLLYKEEIERSLRTPEYGGFQLLGLQDSYDQGSAFVGQIDNFFDPKPYLTAKEFRRFCAPVVPLARLSKRVWQNNEKFAAKIEIANYGPEKLRGKLVNWKLTSADSIIKKGTFGPMSIANTGLQQIGSISCDLSGNSEARKLKLTVNISDSEISNDWDLWVYPAQLTMPAAADLIVTENLSAEIEAKLRDGAKVVLLPNNLKTKYATAMTPPFWSPLMFSNQKQILGLMCQTNHPALKNFPTDKYSNWQWWGLTRNGSAVNIDSMGTNYRPVVGGIDQPQSCHRLGIVFEGKVGKGSLLVCTLDLNRNLKNRPVARQLRYSLLTYAASDAFNPDTELDPAQILPAPKRTSILASKQLVKSVKVDSEHENQWGIFAVDGNPDTIWHTRWDATVTPHPHQITIELKTTQTFRGIIQTPRTDCQNGYIAKYKIYVSDDGNTWREIARGTWPNTPAPKKLFFKNKVTAKFIKLEALSEVNGNPWTSIAELDIIQ